MFGTNIRLKDLIHALNATADSQKNLNLEDILPLVMVNTMVKHFLVRYAGEALQRWIYIILLKRGPPSHLGFEGAVIPCRGPGVEPLEIFI